MRITALGRSDVPPGRRTQDIESYRIALLAGDGIGPEVVGATHTVLAAVNEILSHQGCDLELSWLPLGLAALPDHGSTLPAKTFAQLRECHGAVLGPVSTHEYALDQPGVVNPSKTLRKDLDLYANIRPVRSYRGLRAFHKDIDCVVVRENTEGFYSDRNLFQGDGEFQPERDLVLSIRVVSRRASLRIARAAFELARQRGGRQRVTVAHKANVLRKGCGLFLDACRTVAAEFPDVAMDSFHVDALAMHLVMRPQDFDVIVATNLFGDVLSDLTAGLVGGLGLAPGLNAGEDLAVAQAVHGSAPDIAGRNIANPLAEILSAGMLLDWLAERHNSLPLVRAARAIRFAVEKVVEDGACLTPDLGGGSSTTDVARLVSAEIQLLMGDVGPAGTLQSGMPGPAET